MNANCAHCGKAFQSKRTTAIYCGSSCRTKAHYARKGIGKTPRGSSTAPGGTNGLRLAVEAIQKAVKPSARKVAVSGPPNPEWTNLNAHLQAAMQHRKEWQEWRNSHVAAIGNATGGASIAPLIGAATLWTVGRPTGKRQKYDPAEQLAMAGLGWFLGSLFKPDRTAPAHTTHAEAIQAIQKADENLRILDVGIAGIQARLASTPQYLLPAQKTNSPATSSIAAPRPQTPGIVSSMELAKMQFDTLPFTGKWRDLIGLPTKGFYAMVTAPPKYGKSNLCMQLADYLTRFGRVLYVAGEEGVGYTLQQKVLANNSVNNNLDIAGPLPAHQLIQLARSGQYASIILDSVNRLKLEPEDLEHMKGSVNLIAVLQSTKDGSFKGSREWEHNVDVVITMPQPGHAIQRGRFNAGGELQVFQAADDIEQLRLMERTLG